MGKAGQTAKLGRQVDLVDLEKVFAELLLLGQRQTQFLAARGEEHQSPLPGGIRLRQNQLSVRFFTPVGGASEAGTGHARTDGDAMTVTDGVIRDVQGW